MSNKIGFNNFKAFGSQMQYFTKKPITLIYGPNSVGKSSLLHSQIYLDYLRKTIPNINLFETYFAGDKLDLGGFRTFIHKHETSLPIIFELDITKKEDLYNLMALDKPEIKQLLSYDLINMDFSIENLNQFLNQELENKLKMSTIISLVRYEKKVHESKKLLNKYPKNLEIELFHEDNLKSYKITKRVAIFEILLNNLKNIEDPDELQNRKKEIEAFKETGVNDKILLTIDKYIKKIKESNDDLTQCIILSGESKPETIKVFFHYLNYLFSIKNIKFKISLESYGNKINTPFEYFIDNELLFNTQNNTVNKNHPLIGYLEQLQTSKKLTKEEFDDLDDDSKKAFEQHYNSYFILKQNKLNLFNYSMFQNEIKQFMDDLQKKYPAIWDFERLAYEFVNYQKIEQNIQYYGPLRFYPERLDLYLKNKKPKQKKHKKYEDNLLDLNNIESVFNKVPFIFFRPLFWKRVLTSQKLLDAFNGFLPDKSKLSQQEESSSSKQMWDKLIQSKDMQDKLNIWLSDEKKLKSTYLIKVYEEDNHKNLVFLDTQKQTEVTPRDMGLGISQMLPILISTMGSENTKIYLEQPELHLHPAVQMELMDEFIKSHNENNNEFMMESHSEHMLLRVMKRLRQTADETLEDESLRLTPDDVCLLYVDNDGEQTYIRELRLSKNGKLLDHWPNGFFEEGYKERFL